MVLETASAGRWKYMVAFGVFVVNFFNTGTAKSFGVLIPELKHDFDTGLSILGFGIGMCHGVAVGLTFMSRLLLTKVTCRVQTMFGGLVAGIGIFLCSISNSAVLFTFGIAIAGFGYSFMIISNLVIIKEYFVDSYSLALSVVFSGGAMGMMLIPVITEKFANIYGWRGAVLLISALNFHNVAAGALYRPFKPCNSTSNSTSAPAEADGVMGEQSGSDSEFNLKRTPDSTAHSLLRGSKNGQREDSASCIGESEGGCKANEDSLTNTPKFQECERLSKFDKRTHPKELQEQRLSERESSEDITRNYLQIAKDASRTPDYDNYSDRESESANLLHQDQSYHDNNNNTNTTNDSGRICGVKDVFDFRLMCEFPAINLVMIVSFLSGATTTGWIAFLVPNGQKKGYLVSEAVLLATIGGFGNVIGRFGVGFAIGKRTSARAWFLFCNLVCGVAFCLNYVTFSFWGLSILSMLNGSTIGAMTVLVCLMIEEIVEDTRYASAVALVYFFLGAGELVGGLFAGWIYDMTGAYEIPFVALGSLNFLAALLTLPTLSSCSR